MTEEVKTRGRKAKPKYEFICEHKDYLKDVGVKLEWIDSLQSQYDFNKIEYVHKFHAFRCYQNDMHVDWIDINDLALLNGARDLVVILLKHQRVSPKRAVIQYRWR